jgi:T-complex protein 1 subunit eta
MQPPVILLKEGTDTSQGKPQLISNINACTAIVEILQTTLGPRGLDKLIYEGTNKTTISNDGATIMNLLDIVHPAARTLVDIAKSQDDTVGDGTTSVVVLAGALLLEAKQFIEDGVHPNIIIRGYRQACTLARKLITDLSVQVDSSTDENVIQILERCAATALNSKLVASKRDIFAPMVVKAVMHLDRDLSLDMVGIKKETGGALEDSELVEGVAFKKTFSYAGFEQQRKRFENAKVLALNLELELKAEKDNAELRVNDPSQYQAMIDAEWRILFEKLNNIANSGANVVLSRLAIGDLATQFFADKGLFCAGRVEAGDLMRVHKATGAIIQSTVNGLTSDVLGTCGLFEERQVGRERYNFFTGCPKARTATIIIRGGGEAFNDEAERSLHDAIMVVRRARMHSNVVAGGGAIEMELSCLIKDQALQIHGKLQMIMLAYARALESIPRQVAKNAGFDSVNILNQLRQRHTQGGKWYGVDINQEGICDTFESFVWEPSLVRHNAVTAATEAACLILSVDETVRNPKAEGAPPPMPGMGRMGR